MTLDCGCPRAGRGRGPGRSGRGTPRADRTGASGAAAAPRRAGRRCRSTARRPESRPWRRAGPSGSRPAAGTTPGPARSPGSTASSGSSFSSRREVPEVLAVGRGVLADEEDLLDLVLAQPPGLGEDVGGPPRDEGPAEHRDGAEGAAPVAATGDLQRGPWPVIQTRADDAGAAGRDRSLDGRALGDRAGPSPGTTMTGQRHGSGRGLSRLRRERQQPAAVAKARARPACCPPGSP